MIKTSKNAVICIIFALILLYFAFFNTNINNNFCLSKSLNSVETTAKAMAVMEKTTGRILYSKNLNERLPMASTTKIITAIFIIENCDDLDKKVEISKTSVGIEGTSIGLKEGEHLSIRELLYGLMLRSGNDAAVALAEAVCGSVKEFCIKVNQFVFDLGAKNTHLENPHGLPNDSHYTTAYDLALISAYALNNPVFQEIVSTKKVEVSNELKSLYSRTLINKNKLLKNYEFADGVKTGYTKKAGRCFVGSATKNGMQLVCVLLNCGPMFEECETLLEKGFNEYSMVKLLEKDYKIADVQVIDSKVKNIPVVCDRDFYYPLTKDELGKVSVDIDAVSSLVAPIKIGQQLAELSITLENQLIFSHKFYTIKEVENNTFKDKFNKILQGM